MWGWLVNVIGALALLLFTVGVCWHIRRGVRSSFLWWLAAIFNAAVLSTVFVAGSTILFEGDLYPHNAASSLLVLACFSLSFAAIGLCFRVVDQILEPFDIDPSGNVSVAFAFVKASVAVAIGYGVFQVTLIAYFMADCISRSSCP